MERHINNKVAVITGGAEGIGFAIADKFLSKKAKAVVILDINEDLGVEAAKKLNAKYGERKAEFYKCDVITDLETVSKKIFDKYPIVDVLVNNAGIAKVKNVRNIIGVNLYATINWSYKFREHMRKDNGGKGGTIINMGSVYSYKIDPLAVSYKATKFGVRGFSMSLGHSYNYEKSGVRVLCLCPGLTNTSLVTEKNLSEVSIDRRKFLIDTSSQQPEAVGEAACVIFEIAESGTVWEIDGGEPVKEVITNIKYNKYKSRL